jgi:hypothetical protein
MKHGHNFKDLTGKIFGRLIVFKFDRSDGVNTYWAVKCLCGVIFKIRGAYLRSGKTQSCGCLQKEIHILTKTTHGMFGTKFYTAWVNMKQRCLNPKNTDYINYGGRGITVCKRWLKFENFRDDMYESYLKHVEKFGENDTFMDRKEVHGNYELGNVRWATKSEQAQNTRISSNTTNYNEHNYWKHKLISRINMAVKRNSRYSFVEKYLGCTLPEFKRYIESKFQSGMAWKNHGKGPDKWQFDHIKGCNNFDLSKEEERLKCFYFTNFQPLWDEKHKKKSNQKSI